MWATTLVLAAVGVAAAAVVAVLLLASTDESTAAWVAGCAGTALAVCLLAAAVVRFTAEYRHYRYEVTDLGLYVSHGWLWRRWQVVPHSRVQTVDTRAGPLHRLFGLVAIHVTTASASGGTTVPGLSPPVAAELIDELARRAELDEGT
jgi:membrane protein YdbS with pleckstrin-like domain